MPNPALWYDPRSRHYLAKALASPNWNHIGNWTIIRIANQLEAGDLPGIKYQLQDNTQRRLHPTNNLAETLQLIQHIDQAVGYYVPTAMATVALQPARIGQQIRHPAILYYQRPISGHRGVLLRPDHKPPATLIDTPTGLNLGAEPATQLANALTNTILHQWWVGSPHNPDAALTLTNRGQPRTSIGPLLTNGPRLSYPPD